jgi:phosphoserine phosphatase RsbU/P
MTSNPLAPMDQATLEDHYHRAPCAYVSARPDGTVLRVNQTFLEWTGLTDEEVVGARFTDLLTAGGRVFYETNYLPVLHLQGEVRDLALELRRVGRDPLPVLMSSLLVEDVGGEPQIVRSTIFDATARHEHERELLAARRRAEVSEAQIRSVALQLQRAMLAGTVSGGPGFVVETRYRPAVEDLEVGGDWYDAFLLPDRDVVNVSVGDVVGRGINAACAMGQIRSALRAIAVSGVGPGRTLDQLDAFVDPIYDAHSATVVCAEVDLGDRWVRYACAGHLPPLLLQPDGTVDHLWDGRSTPLAAVPQAGPRREGEATLLPGSRLLLYTDGLVERRDRGLDEGLATLVEVVADRATLPPGEMVDAIVATMLEHELVRDDVCVLCLALDADPATG